MRKFWKAQRIINGEFTIIASFTHTMQDGRVYEYWQIFGDNRCYSAEEIDAKFEILSQIRMERKNKNVAA